MLANNYIAMELRSSVLCGQDKVTPSRSKTVAVTVAVWKKLLQDTMSVVHDSLLEI